MSTITYDEPGVIYDDSCYLYDGHNICKFPFIEQRPAYWLGRRTREEEEKHRKRNFLSVFVQAQPISVNGYDLDHTVKEIRFAAEDDETIIQAKPTQNTVVDDPYEVRSIPLATALIGCKIDSEGVIEGDTLPEIEGTLLDSYEEEYRVIGSLFGKDDLLMEAMVLTGSLGELRLVATKNKGSAIFTMEPLVTNDRTDKDPEDES